MYKCIYVYMYIKVLVVCEKKSRYQQMHSRQSKNRSKQL